MPNETTPKAETTEEEPMITMRLSEWLRMDGEIKQLRAALVEVLTARRERRPIDDLLRNDLLRMAADRDCT